MNEGYMNVAPTIMYFSPAGVTPEIEAYNKAWWQEHKVIYDYRCETTQRPKPDLVDKMSRYGNFMSVPLNDRVLWAFKTEDGRDQFVKRFRGRVIE